ncbi:MAG: shikimate dehydrogenase, partial [Gammaproteobacteria bacterium]|nr:shikimate dehydrogenase [Gammaproteobacteria bacterium]
MTDRYMVVGNPIAHSKSPQIHSMFAEQTGQDLIYEKQQVEAGEFVQVLNAFQQLQGRGMNVTVPYKHEAWEAVDELSPRAQRAGAVNTIQIRDDGSRYGDNTDG